MSPKQIRWTTQASNQLDAIYEYIADDNGNAALAQVTRVSEAVLRLSDHSQMAVLGGSPPRGSLWYSAHRTSSRIALLQMSLRLSAFTMALKKWPRSFPP